MTTPFPKAYDPTARLRELYRAADDALLRLLADTVAATIEQPAQRWAHEIRLQRETRRIVNQLAAAATAEVDAILDQAPQDGRQRADDDQA